MFKAMVTIDGVLETVHPDLDIIYALDSMRDKLVQFCFAGFAARDRLGSIALELLRVVEETPHFMRSASKWLDH